MQAQSDEAVRVPTGSHKQVISVSAWCDGALLAADLPIVSGSLQITAGQNIRSRLTLDVADESGLLAPKPDSPLSPWGSELHVRAGVMVGTVPELLSLGWFPIMTAETTEQWREYVRPEEPEHPYRVSRGMSVSVEAVDRAQIVLDARFEAREQPTQSHCIAEVGALLQGVVPWRNPGGLTDHVVPSGLTYDDDRLGAWGTLATALDCDPIIDVNGIATLLPTEPDGDPVWTIRRDAGGTLIDFTRSLHRDKIYNVVIARATDSESGVTLQGRAQIDTGPLRYDGPLGRIPYFESLPVLGTVEALQRAAVTSLDRLQRRRSQTVNVSTIANFALECGDIVSLECPYGFINGEVTVITYPLTPGPMSLTIAVNPVDFAAVS